MHGGTIVVLSALEERTVVCNLSASPLIESSVGTSWTRQKPAQNTSEKQTANETKLVRRDQYKISIIIYLKEPKGECAERVEKRNPLTANMV